MKMPAMDYMDPKFKRLHYTRYADDWVILLSGSYSDATNIKRKVAEFLKDKLGLTLSEEKTKITSLRHGKVSFLGVEMHIRKITDNNVKPRSMMNIGGSEVKRRQNPRLILHALIEKLINKLMSLGFAKRRVPSPLRAPIRTCRRALVAGGRPATTVRKGAASVPPALPGSDVTNRRARAGSTAPLTPLQHSASTSRPASTHSTAVACRCPQAAMLNCAPASSALMPSTATATAAAVSAPAAPTADAVTSMLAMAARAAAATAGPRPRSSSNGHATCGSALDGSESPPPPHLQHWT
jgi:hypothetical protein